MQQNKGVTLAWYVARRISSESNVPQRSRIFKIINGIIYCSCQEDVKSVEPYRHIQCVLSGAFQSNPFHPRFKRNTNVEIKATYKNDIVGFSQSHDHFEFKEEDIGINKYDETAVFVQKYAGLHQITQEMQFKDSPVAQETALGIASRFPEAKKCNILSSKTMYNTILVEGQYLSNIASYDNRETDNITITVMWYMRANIQNKSGSEMKEAAATYLGATNFRPNTKILPSSRKSTKGRASTKSKNSDVESETIASMKHCDFCSAQGDNKFTFQTIKSKGERLTSSCWDYIMSFQPTNDAISYENIDPVAPSHVMVLQVVESFAIWDKTYLKVNVLMVGLAAKIGSATWLKNIPWPNGTSWERVLPSLYSLTVWVLRTIKALFYQYHLLLHF